MPGRSGRIGRRRRREIAGKATRAGMCRRATRAGKATKAQKNSGKQGDKPLREAFKAPGVVAVACKNGAKAVSERT